MARVAVGGGAVADFADFSSGVRVRAGLISGSAARRAAVWQLPELPMFEALARHGRGR